MADVLLVVALKTDQPNIERRLKSILAATEPVTPDTEAVAWAKPVGELVAADLDALAAWSTERHRDPEAALRSIAKTVGYYVASAEGQPNPTPEGSPACTGSEAAGRPAAAIRGDEPPTHRWQRPDIHAPLIVWEYVFALERMVEDLQARLKKANGHV